MTNIFQTLLEYDYDSRHLPSKYKFKNRELNNFNHIYGSTLLHQRHNPKLADFVLDVHEKQDVRDAYKKYQDDMQKLQNRLEDSIIDGTNNLIGKEIAKEFPDINKESIKDYIYKYYIQNRQNKE